MRQEQNRREIDKLYILGAGCSYSLSSSLSTNGMTKTTTPLDYNFLEHLQEFTDRNAWVANSIGHIKRNWMDELKLNNHGLEEAIIKRIGQYDFLSKLHPQKTIKKSSNADYVDHLSHLISKFLLKCKANTRDRHKKFIDHAFPRSQTPSDLDNRIITFNYDTILDEVLLDRATLTQRQIYFDRLLKEENDNSLRRSNQKFSHPLLLKLHGSINWNVNTNYFKKIIENPSDINPDEKEPIWINRKKTPSPTDNVSPLIIPPLPNKPITQVGIFNYLWTTAYEYLHDAKELIIVGYSCPQTDGIAHAMFSHFTNKNIERVVIIDPDANMLSKYRGLFKSSVSKGIRWQYYENFQEYVDDEC